MKSRRITGAAAGTFVLVFEPEDEVIAELTAFAARDRIAASHFTGIGAFRDAVVGYFDRGRKDYVRIRIGEQVEVLSLAGDITLEKGEPKVHAHVVLGKRDATAHGGHLLEAHVWPTLEVVLEEMPANLVRRFDASTGLSLIALDQ